MIHLLIEVNYVMYSSERETSLVLSASSPNATAVDQAPPQLYWTQLRSDLLAKRDQMARTLAKAGLRPIVPEAGYFMLADISPLAQQFPEQYASQQDIDGKPNTMDYKLARWLSNERKLQIIPGSAFYASEANKKSLGSKLGRFCFIKSASTLEKFDQLMDQLISDAKINRNLTESNF